MNFCFLFFFFTFVFVFVHFNEVFNKNESRCYLLCGQQVSGFSVRCGLPLQRLIGGGCFGRKNQRWDEHSFMGAEETVATFPGS